MKDRGRATAPLSLSLDLQTDKLGCCSIGPETSIQTDSVQCPGLRVHKVSTKKCVFPPYTVVAMKYTEHILIFLASSAAWNNYTELWICAVPFISCS